MHRRLFALFVVGACSALSVAARPAWAQTPSPADARQVIVQNYDAIATIIKETKDETAMQERIRERMEGFVDFPLFGQLALKDHYPTLKPAEQTEYLALFKRLIQRTYLKRFHANQTFSVEVDPQVEVTGDGKKALVKSVVRSGQTAADVHYKLYVPEGQKAWLVFDVLVDEVSYVRNYRSSFEKTWQKGGYALLVEKMKKKADQAVKPEEGDDDL